ncbi:hypothetical protein PMAYCL1PPCAC_07216, partial [Pristionchus mayeri]
LSSHLSCDFQSECCWSSPIGQKWVRRHRIGINDYTRTFMVGRGRPPPKSNFIVRAQKSGESLYESCPFCTSNGIIHIQYRHWQSPSADLRICWRVSNETLSSDRCQKISPSRQSQLISQQIVVPQKRDVQISFILSRSDDRNSEGVAILDKIAIKSALCLQENEVSPPGVNRLYCTHSFRPHRLESPPSPPPPPPPPRSSPPPPPPPPPHPTASLPPLPPKITPSKPSSPLLEEQVESPLSSTVILLAQSLEDTPPPPSSIPALSDLLGDDFVKFLDPNYESEDDYKEEETEDREEIITTSSPSTTTTLKTLVPHGHSPSHSILRDTDECSTKGGCLFDRGFCSYTQQQGITHHTSFSIAKS